MPGAGFSWACTRFMMFVEYNTEWRSLCVVLIMGVISKETGTDVERWSWHKDFRQPLSWQSDTNTKYNTIVQPFLHLLVHITFTIVTSYYEATILPNWSILYPAVLLLFLSSHKLYLWFTGTSIDYKQTFIGLRLQ